MASSTNVYFTEMFSLDFRHALLFEGLGGEYNIPMATNARSVREFDEGLTRGTHQLMLKIFYLSLKDYY